MRHADSIIAAIINSHSPSVEILSRLMQNGGSPNPFSKLANDMPVVGLISGRHETAYRDELQRLSMWCSENNLAINTSKTTTTKKKKNWLVTWGEKKQNTKTNLGPIHIKADCVEQVSDFWFLAIHVSWRPLLDCQHHHNNHEGPATTLHPEDPQK